MQQFCTYGSVRGASGKPASLPQHRRDPTWQPVSGKGRAYKAGRLKSRGARRESEGLVVAAKACKITRRREGALL